MKDHKSHNLKFNSYLDKLYNSNKRLIIAVDAGDTSLLGTATAGAGSVTTDTLLEYFARYCDVLDVNFEMEQIDLDAGTD